MRAPILTQKHARALRRAMTEPERVLWALLRRRQQALRFRRQHAMGPYILDFYCSEARLCIEIDGIAHASPEAAAHDERRTKWLTDQGIRVLRFNANDILKDENLPGVFTAIEAVAASR